VWGNLTDRAVWADLDKAIQGRRGAAGRHGGALPLPLRQGPAQAARSPETMPLPHPLGG
jgi:hypothetical protein